MAAVILPLLLFACMVLGVFVLLWTASGNLFPMKAHESNGLLVMAVLLAGALIYGIVKYIKFYWP